MRAVVGILALEYAVAIPLAALIIAVASLLVGTIGQRKARSELADQKYVEQLEKRVDDEVKRNDRLEEQLSGVNLRLLACEEARRQVMEDNARLLYFKVFGKEMPDGPGPIPRPT